MVPQKIKLPGSDGGEKVCNLTLPVRSSAKMTLPQISIGR